MRLLAIEPSVFARLRDGSTDNLKPTESHGVLFARGGTSRRDGRIAVLSLSGLMDQKPSAFLDWVGGTSTEQFGAAFDAAMSDESVKAIVLDIDSGGGYTNGVPELASKVFAARGVKPVAAVANPMAASAAFYVATAAEKLYVTASGQGVGSVGAIMSHVDASGFFEQMGVKETLIVSEQSPYKAEGNSGEPLSEDAREEFQSLVNEVAAEFIADVAKHRGVSVEHVEANFGKGRMKRGKAAVSAGMADGVASLETVVFKTARAVRGRSTAAMRRRLELGRRA